MPLPLPLLLLLLLQQTLACEELTCFADYLQMLMCTWGWSLRPSWDAPYNLTAKWNCGAGGTCHLLPSTGNTTAAQFTCLAEQKLCFGDNAFDVTATTPARNGPPGVSKGCSKTFLFKENIKPQPPFNLTANASPSGYNISWKTPYQHWHFHPLNGRLHYELRYRQRGRAWQGKNQKDLLQDTGTLWLLPREFEGAPAEYEVQVRARPSSPYQGAWSMWSSPASLTALSKTSDHQVDEGGASQWLVVLGLFPALLAFLGQRLWKKLDLFVPSPAPFFQPLYLGHKGDFKKWVGTSGAGITLEVFERGPGVSLEAFGMDSLQLLLPSPDNAESREARAAGQGAPLATPTAPLLAAEGPESTAQEQTYGHLSIDTVTVAGGVVPCCPQCDRCAGSCCAAEQPQQQEEEEEQKEGEEAGARDTYRRIHFKGSSQDGEVPGTVLLVEAPPQENTIPPFSSWPSPSSPAAPATLPPFQHVGGSLGGGPGKGPLFLFGPPLPSPPSPEHQPLNLGGLSPPDEETLFYSTLLSLHLEADDEGDPENGLDLDTIDSGFVDCDCGSPLDLEEGAAAGDPLPSYVKQWLKA